MTAGGQNTSSVAKRQESQTYTFSPFATWQCVLHTFFDEQEGWQLPLC